MPPAVLSCVVDAHPKFRLQSLNFIASVLTSGTAPAEAILVHLVNAHPAVYRDTLAKIGVRVCEAEPLGTAASPYCNKLVQLRSRPVLTAEAAWLCDTDVVLTADLSGLLVRPGIRAKTVDTAIPPLPLLLALLRRAGFRQTPRTVPTAFGHGDTVHGNCNGGLYCYAGPSLARIAPYWIKWALWTLEQAHLLGTCVKHADQIGFLLALLETGLDVSLLPLEMNFPTHLKKTTYSLVNDLTPGLVHYHNRLDADGLLLPLGLPRVDAVIAATNARLRAFHERVLPPALLRDYRATLPSPNH